MRALGITAHEPAQVSGRLCTDVVDQLIATVRNVGYKFVGPLSPRQRTEQQHPANANTEAVEPTTDPTSKPLAAAPYLSASPTQQET